MPSISKKGQNMPASPIRKLVPYAEAAKQRGVHVYHLNIGQPDIESPKEALEALHNFDQPLVEYSHSAGFESYRAGLAAAYNALNIPVSKNEIIVTTGGSEALMFGFMACLEPGDEIIVPEPFYANYIAFAMSAGANIVPVPSSIETGFALPPIAEFEKRITPRTRAILICNPGNPTGYLYTREELETLSKLVREHDLWLFSDEVYREFCYDGRKHISVMEFPEMAQHTIMVDSVSKRYSLCGVRIGCFATKNKEVYNTILKFAQARLSPPSLGQIVSEAALKAPQSYFDNVVEEYTARRNFAVEALNSIPGVICPNPGGAFYAMVQLPVENAEEFCIWMLSEFSHSGATVMMAPAAGFYSTPGIGLNQVRIAYVLNKDDLQAAVECLRYGLVAYAESKEKEKAIG
ncbi:MAG: pyridoxal phosphate-dependent aminotransferase [Bacteroidia bacterium]|nr:pyridoxal phosphate-dependent aminotransferase [Bacteroidia bacterium]